MVARWAHNPKVIGSNPVPATKKPHYAAFFVLISQMMFVVYVLHSVNYNKIYIGFTTDLEKRFLSHNELATKGWTIKFRLWKIVHTEDFKSKAEAMKREKELKSHQGREFIRNNYL